MEELREALSEAISLYLSEPGDVKHVELEDEPGSGYRASDASANRIAGSRDRLLWATVPRQRAGELHPRRDGDVVEFRFNV